MARGQNTHHRSFSIAVGLAAIATGALLAASCATSSSTPGAKMTPAPTTSQVEAGGKVAPTKTGGSETEPATTEAPAGRVEAEATSVEKPAPSTEAATPASETAPASYPGTQEHIRKLEASLRPLKSIPSKRD